MGCCARAANGQAVTAPANPEMKSRRHIARPGKHRAQILGIGMDRRQPIFRSQFSNLVSTRNDNGIVSDGQRIGVFIHCFFERNLDILRLFHVAQ